MRELGADSGWGAPEAGEFGQSKSAEGTEPATNEDGDGDGDGEEEKKSSEEDGDSSIDEATVRLRVGDVLLAINGRPLVSFLPFEEECDAAMERLQMAPPTSVAQLTDGEEGDGNELSDDGTDRDDPNASAETYQGTESSAIGGDQEATELGASCSAPGAASSAWIAAGSTDAAKATTRVETQALRRLASERGGDLIGALLDS